MNEESIGILDSGFGGLTAMRLIRELLPYENILYFGDTAHLPYGNKSAETITRYCLENIAFLLEKKIKLLVIACHSACTAALPILREAFAIPIIGITEQGIEEVVAQTKKGKIAILGTRATIASGVYQKNLLEKLPLAEIHSIACPLFVPLVEEGYADHPITSILIKEYLRPIQSQEIDTVLLGCTHYPLLASQIKSELNPDTLLIDPALGCARKTRQLLTEKNLLHPQQLSPKTIFFVSDDPEKFRLIGKSFLSPEMLATSDFFPACTTC